MANMKEYAYYVKGNKIAVVENDNTPDNDPNSRDYGRGHVHAIYKSPLTGVSDGLEIEYAYSPKYQISSNPTINVNKFYVLGWTIVDGYLTFLRNGKDTNTLYNWTNSPENAVTSGSSGDAGGQTLDYILVRGSSRWNGLHRIKSAGATGRLQTYTKVSDQIPYFQDVDFDWNSDWSIYDGGGSDELHLADHFSAGDYIWTTGASSYPLWGMFKVSSVTQSSTDTSSKVFFDEAYIIPESDDSTTSSTGLENVYVRTLADVSGSTSSAQTDMHIYKAFYDHCYILTDVDVLNNEADEVPVNDYLSKAIVYYIKGRLSEDRMDIEAKEYFMREFYRMLDKYDSSKIHSIRMVQPPSIGVR